jgi:glyoxalase family protein
LDKELIDRINALARMQKAGGLSDEEICEQAQLRKTYIRELREGMQAQLEQIWIQNEDGTYEKVQKKDSV